MCDQQHDAGDRFLIAVGGGERIAACFAKWNERDGHGTWPAGWGDYGTITATFANGTYSITAGASGSFSETAGWGEHLRHDFNATGTTGSAGTAWRQR